MRYKVPQHLMHDVLTDLSGSMTHTFKRVDILTDGGGRLFSIVDGRWKDTRNVVSALMAMGSVNSPVFQLVMPHPTDRAAFWLAWSDTLESYQK